MKIYISLPRTSDYSELLAVSPAIVMGLVKN